MIGAEILTQAMSASGTSVVFSLSGNQIMPIYDACLEPGIRIVHVRHEGAAVFMADAWAQLCPARGTDSREPAATAADASVTPDSVASACYGVALVTAGPGFANALGALYSAQMAESPVILISGDSPVSQDGKRAFQELSQTAASAAFVKHAVRVTDARDLVDAWQRCVEIATSGRPGPVHLSLPFDVLLSDAESAAPSPQVSTQASSQLSTQVPTPQSPSAPVSTVSVIGNIDAQKVTQVIDALSSAEKPVIVTGPSMTASRMPQRISRLQQAVGIPVIPMESPRGLADPSLGKVSAVLQQADCVLLLGKLPDFTVGFAASDKLPAKTLIVVDADEVSLRQSTNVVDRSRCIALHASPVALADELCAHFSRSSKHVPDSGKWLETAGELLTEAPRPDAGAEAPVNTASDKSGGNQLLTPQQIGSHVQTAVDQCEHSILVCDGGEFGQWAQACVRSERRVINGCSGAIGGSVPQAVAARIGHPDSVVFCLLGDGTIGFHLAELETSIREQAPVIVIIGNDSRWNAEYQIQLRDYGADRLHSCELGTNIRYDVAAVGLGCAGAMVTSEAELAEALADAIERSGQGQSTCINVSMSGWPAPVFS